MSSRSVIYEAIVGGFLQEAKNAIASALITSAPDSSAVDKLTAVLRVTLHFFKENSRSGKVTLVCLDMKRRAFQPIHQIFKYIDSVIGETIEKGEIVPGLPPSQIRLILFWVMLCMNCSMRFTLKKMSRVAPEVNRICRRWRFIEECYRF